MIKRMLLFLSMLLLIGSGFSGTVKAITNSDLKSILTKTVYFEEVEQCAVSQGIATDTSSTNKTDANEANRVATYQFLIGKGLTPIQTVGWMANIQAESGFRTNAQESTSGLDPRAIKEGFGLVQWTNPEGNPEGRRYALFQAAAKQGVPVTDLNFQLNYMWDEISRMYGGKILRELQATTSIYDAHEVILVKYEAPAEEYRIERRTSGPKLAAQYLLKYAGLTGVAGTNSSCAGGTSLVDCSGAAGNAKLVCAAQQNFGTIYCYTDNRNGHLGNCGHGVKQWLEDVKQYGKDSKYYATECSGFVNIAFYLAFNENFDYCSSGYAADTKNFERIPLESVQAGDLVIQHINEACGTTNHIAIVESYDPSTNKLVTLESTAGRNDAGDAGISGRLSTRVLGEDFDGAIRYIGKGVR